MLVAAGDTFRAAAIDQLKIWADRTGAGFVAREPGADASGLAYDAIEQARAEGRDVLLIDTAGRLQNKQGLMDELGKIVRVIRKLDPEAPHATLLVLDATVGQNAVSQVEIFKQVAGVTGLVMTKLDGTARGAFSWRWRPSSACPCTSSVLARASRISSPSPRRTLPARSPGSRKPELRGSSGRNRRLAFAGRAGEV